MNTPFPKRCAVCALVHDRRSWEALPEVGEAVAPATPEVWRDGVLVDDGRPMHVVLRSCLCGNTLAVNILEDQ